MTFNTFIPGHKNCEVYIANIIIIECGYQYSAYSRDYLYRNAETDYSAGVATENKNTDTIYMFKRLIDSNP